MTKTNTVLYGYNGEEIVLPMEEKKLEEVFNKMKGFDLADHSTNLNIVKRMIVLYEYAGPSFISLETLKNINEVVSYIEDNDLDVDVLNALDYAGRINEEMTGEEMEDAIDNRSWVYVEDLGLSDEENVGYALAEDLGIIEQIPKNLQYYFDYERYGRDAIIEHFYDEESGILVFA